jgi:hypothetical protein
MTLGRRRGSIPACQRIVRLRPLTLPTVASRASPAQTRAARRRCAQGQAARVGQSWGRPAVHTRGRCGRETMAGGAGRRGEKATGCEGVRVWVRCAQGQPTSNSRQAKKEKSSRDSRSDLLSKKEKSRSCYLRFRDSAKARRSDSAQRPCAEAADWSAATGPARREPGPGSRREAGAQAVWTEAAGEACGPYPGPIPASSGDSNRLGGRGSS